jgi:hypothetical protein
VGVPTSTTLTWSAGVGATNYYLLVGTTPGGSDVVNSGALAASQTSYPVTLPAGKTLYATVYTYTSAPGGPTSSSISFGT